MMAIAAVGNNLITYVFNDMHFPLSKSANIVTNFIGTVFLLSLLGGFLSDSYLGSFWTMLIFGFVELSVSLSTSDMTSFFSLYICLIIHISQPTICNLHFLDSCLLRQNDFFFFFLKKKTSIHQILNSSQACTYVNIVIPLPRFYIKCIEFLTNQLVLD